LAYEKSTSSAEFPLRLLPAFAAIAMPPDEGIARLKGLMKKNNERLRYGLVKIVTDGSIQGLSARMRWPGYYDGTPNGMWNIGPDEIDRILLAYHRAGFQVHIHTNGDEASEVAIESVERALSLAPRWDYHWGDIHYARTMGPERAERMDACGTALGVGVPFAILDDDPLTMVSEKLKDVPVWRTMVGGKIFEAPRS
jgi:predicted amidohydrolase YtcJ